jgi:type II secretory pathway component PulM
MNSSIIKSFTQFLNENSIIQAAMKQAEEEARKAELAAQTASPTTAEPSPTVSTSSAATTSEFSTSRNDEM